MPKRFFSNWLTAFLEYASYGEAPSKMIFWTGVSTIAGALRRRVWIDQKYFQWLPNFYIIFVAPPGIVSKTTTANIGMSLLRGLPEGTINFGADSVTWQSLVQSLGESCESVPDPRDPGAFFPMSSVTFCSDELGNLLKPSDDDLVSALITLWDGKEGAFKKDTKNSGKDKIVNPWVNIIGCTTPSWIAGNFPEYMIGGGFTSRCVFIYEEKKRQYVPYPDEVVPKDFQETRSKLIHDLELISMMFGEYKIDENARIWGRAWYRKHWERPPSGLTGDQFNGYLARKQTHLHKLAMVLSASSSDHLIIRAEHLESAAGIMSAIEADMPRVFARIGQNEITRGSTEILYMVERHPGISQSDLYTSMFRTLSYKDFVDALAGCINSLQIRSVQQGNTLKLFPTKGPDNEREDSTVH